MNDIRLAVKNLIDARWRGERKRACVFCAVAAVFQLFLCFVFVCLVGVLPFATAVLCMTVPIGWVIPLIAIDAWFKGSLLRRDLDPENFIATHGRVEKCPLEGDPDAEQHISLIGEGELLLTADQHLAMSTRTETLLVPLAYWYRLPDVLDAQCEYLRHSKLAYRINGQEVWESQQANPQT